MGQQMSEKFNLFNTTMYQWNWYYFPADVQKMLILVFADAQEPVIVRGFADTLCARESFKKVMQKLRTISGEFITT